jgi:hypothetical protein
MKKTVGEEETNFFLNSMEEMSFADQLIERREIHAYNGTH